MAATKKIKIEELLERALKNISGKVIEFRDTFSLSARSNWPELQEYEEAKLRLEIAFGQNIADTLTLEIAQHFLRATMDLADSHPAPRFSDLAQSIDNVFDRQERELKLRKIIKSMTKGYQKHIDEIIGAQTRSQSLSKEMRNLENSVESQGRAIQSLEQKIESASRSLEAAYGPLQRKYEEIKERFENDLTHLNKKKKEIDDLSAVVTGKAIVSRYSKSALLENKAADRLRWGALIFMALACSVAAVSFYHATEKFDLEASLFRMVLALFLSVPAAYLARESAKHRKQQYEHLQVALDVQAITPYIASLPIEAQHKLKEEMATRIFVSKNFDHITKETYPINLQEVIVATMNAMKPSTKSERKEKDKDERKGTKAEKEKDTAKAEQAN